MGEESRTIKLPIIDLTAPDRRSTAASIRQACIESGFFYIVNHGLEKDVVKKFFDESRNFFLLPVEDKLKLSMKERRGYSALYAEKLDRALGARGDPKETFRVGPVDGEVSNLNQWPSEELLPTFRPTIEAYHRNILPRYETRDSRDSLHADPQSSLAGTPSLVIDQLHPVYEIRQEYASRFGSMKRTVT